MGIIKWFLVKPHSNESITFENNILSVTSGTPMVTESQTNHAWSR
jgi:hypothetical protein